MFTPEFATGWTPLIHFRLLRWIRMLILRVVNKFLLQLEAQLQEKSTSSFQTICAGIWPRRLRPADGRKTDTAADSGHHSQGALADELLFWPFVSGGRGVCRYRQQ